MLADILFSLKKAENNINEEIAELLVAARKVNFQVIAAAVDACTSIQACTEFAEVCSRLPQLYSLCLGEEYLMEETNRFCTLSNYAVAMHSKQEALRAAVHKDNGEDLGPFVGAAVEAFEDVYNDWETNFKDLEKGVGAKWYGVLKHNVWSFLTMLQDSATSPKAFIKYLFLVSSGWFCFGSTSKFGENCVCLGISD